MIEDEIRLESSTTISRYPELLDLVRAEQEDAYESGNSTLSPDVVERLEQMSTPETWEPPVGEVAHDESLVEWVKAELESGAPDEASWSRSLAEAKGDPLAAKHVYVRLRLASLFPAKSKA